MDTSITQISAEEILDSRGMPTIQVDVFAGSKSGRFSVPSGASTGSHEALELRDGDPSRFDGKGVLKAIDNIKNVIAPALLGADVCNQKGVDEKLLELDGTENKSKLGGNATIGVSVACAKTAAAVKNVEAFEYLSSLAVMPHSRKNPFLYLNLINGGLHAKTKLPFQEYHVVPNVDSISEALEIGAEIQTKLRDLIVKKYGGESANVGSEGGFGINTRSVTEPLEILREAAQAAGHETKVKFALDVAASSFYKNGGYEFEGRSHTTGELLEFYGSLIKSFPLVSIEDPFEENDFDSFAKLLSAYQGIRIVGDDLTVTNTKRLKKAIDNSSINAIIIKPNQVGTLTETLAAMKMALDQGVECIVSHRSGETNDDFIADLAYAFGTFGIKAGAPQRGERLAKYNRLKQIEQSVNTKHG